MAPRGCLDKVGNKRSRDGNSHVNFHGNTVNWFMLIAIYFQCNHMDWIWSVRRMHFWRRAPFRNVSLDCRSMLYEGSTSLQLRTLVLMRGMRRQLALGLARHPTQIYGRFDFLSYLLECRKFSKKMLPALRLSRPVVGVKMPTEGVSAVASSSCLTFLAFGLRSGSIWVFDGTSNLIMPYKHEKDVRSLFMDKSILVTGGDDGSVMAFSLGGGLSYAFLMARYVGHSASVWSVCLHKDIIISGSDDRLMALWNLSTGKCDSICEHTDSVLALTVIDADTMISAGSAGHITVWCTRNTKAPSSTDKRLHGDKVTSIKHVDGGVVSFGWGGTICIWVLKDRRLCLLSRYKVQGSRGWVCCVDQLSNMLYTAGNDGKVNAVKLISQTECDKTLVQKVDKEITAGALTSNGMVICTSAGGFMRIELDKMRFNPSERISSCNHDKESDIIANRPAKILANKPSPARELLYEFGCILILGIFLQCYFWH
jgi:WD40 repeat protein